jgi:hypothetical protein
MHRPAQVWRAAEKSDAGTLARKVFNQPPRRTTAACPLTTTSSTAGINENLGMALGICQFGECIIDTV